MKNFINSIGKGTFGIVMVTCTIPTMNKTGNPYYGRLKKISMTSNVAFGYDYSAYLYGKAKKQGLLNGRELKDFQEEVSKPKGKHWDEFPYFLQSDKDENQRYLRAYYNANSVTKSIYLLDGRFVTDERVKEDIKQYIKVSSSTSSKFGLNDIVVRDFKTENVLCLTQGSKIFNKFNNIFTTDEIYSFIKELSK